jgi:hypothetical protein
MLFPVFAGERVLVGLRGAGEEGRQQRGAHAAAQVAGEVGEAGDLVALVARHADVVQRADRDEDERQPDHLQHPPERDLAEADIEADAGEVDKA